MRSNIFETIDDLQSALKDRHYFADRGLSTALFLALKLKRPIFLEGEPGVGKTEVAKVVTDLLETHLIRLQCYEGLDLHQAVYEWNYTRQIMHIRVIEARKEKIHEAELFSRTFLLRRPILEAIDHELPQAPVLLIDELDRSDEEFEAYLLEVLSEYQITIPEIGTIRADEPPVVIITSNRTREVHDALKRRCFYHWIDYPSFDKELAIVRAKLPEASESLARQVTGFVQGLRSIDLYKRPGIAETLDWTAALVALDREALEEQLIEETIGILLKYQDDIDRVNGGKARTILEKVNLGA